MTEFYDSAVVGGGLSGTAAALALARAGQKVAFIAPPAPRVDGRTTALMMPSIGLLEGLGLWSRIGDKAAPLRTLRIVDDSRRLVRAPTVAFRAAEVEETAFGYNIANSDLLAAAMEAVAAQTHVTLVETPATAIDLADGRAQLSGDGWQIDANLVIGADGRNSLVRQAAGIGARAWSYPQTALVTTFSHKRPHDDESTEFHTDDGPFTQVPLPGRRSSLVWVMRDKAAQEAKDLDPSALGRRIEERMHSMLGECEVDGPVQSFPLSGMIAEAFARRGAVLVGEAAHVFPPIGAQGLNLGMRDVGELAAIAADPAGLSNVEAVVARYDRARRLDVRGRTLAVDLLNRSLLTGFVPFRMLRAAGLSALGASAPLRSVLMREGLKPGAAMAALAGSMRKGVGR